MADKPNSTIEEKKKKLIENGKKEGFVSYEQLANEFKGMEIDSDTLNDLYDALMANNIEVISETADNSEVIEDPENLNVEELTMSKDIKINDP